MTKDEVPDKQPKIDWPLHARAAWDHERKRGDRLYAALCEMERDRDAQTRRAEKAEALLADPPEARTCATCAFDRVDEAVCQRGIGNRQAYSDASAAQPNFGCWLHEPAPTGEPQPKEPR